MDGLPVSFPLCSNENSMSGFHLLDWTERPGGNVKEPRCRVSVPASLLPSGVILEE